ncbi:hypothetical protein GO491_07565 [Flavobacteriaceae bacterium Ap0902]|nr:hypothetical protein [Flavobacteriaceae bacterium Ap0902]
MIKRNLSLFFSILAMILVIISMGFEDLNPQSLNFWILIGAVVLLIFAIYLLIKREGKFKQKD